MPFGDAMTHTIFAVSNTTIDYGALNRTNFNTVMDHLTQLLILHSKNQAYGIIIISLFFGSSFSKIVTKMLEIEMALQ